MAMPEGLIAAGMTRDQWATLAKLVTHGAPLSDIERDVADLVADLADHVRNGGRVELETAPALYIVRPAPRRGG